MTIVFLKRLACLLIREWHATVVGRLILNCLLTNWKNLLTDCGQLFLIRYVGMPNSTIHWSSNWLAIYIFEVAVSVQLMIDSNSRQWYLRNIDVLRKFLTMKRGHPLLRNPSILLLGTTENVYWFCNDLFFAESSRTERLLRRRPLSDVSSRNMLVLVINLPLTRVSCDWCMLWHVQHVSS